MKIHNSCGLCRIDVEGLGVADGKEKLLENVNLTLHCGELTVLVGKNGAGKTTLINAMLGQRAHLGTITFRHHDNAAMTRPVTGYVPQHLAFDKSTPVSVLDFMCLNEKWPVWLGHSKAQRSRVKKALERMECAHVIDRRLGFISGGELQRVLLAMAISPIPDLLILDEPVSGIDAAGLNIFYNMVSTLRDNYHLAILLVSHDLHLIHQYADRVVLLDKTVTASGSPQEVFQTAQFQAAFGVLDWGREQK